MGLSAPEPPARGILVPLRLGPQGCSPPSPPHRTQPRPCSPRQADERDAGGQAFAAGRRAPEPVGEVDPSAPVREVDPQQRVSGRGQQGQGRGVGRPPADARAPRPLRLSDVQVTEDAVRRYLTRKPMTTKDLLKKFQTKKTGLSSEQTVNVLAQILKRLNPERKMIGDKMHFSLKE